MIVFEKKNRKSGEARILAEQRMIAVYNKALF